MKRFLFHQKLVYSYRQVLLFLGSSSSPQNLEHLIRGIFLSFFLSSSSMKVSKMVILCRWKLVLINSLFFKINFIHYYFFFLKKNSLRSWILLVWWHKPFFYLLFFFLEQVVVVNISSTCNFSFNGECFLRITLNSLFIRRENWNSHAIVRFLEQIYEVNMDVFKTFIICWILFSISFTKSIKVFTLFSNKIELFWNFFETFLFSLYLVSCFL